MPFPHTIAPKRDIVSTRSSVLFHSYKILVRFRHYSESLSFHSFKRPLPSHSRLNALHSRRSHYTNPDPHTVYCSLPLRHLLSMRKPFTRGFTFTTHLSYSSSGFRFYISDSFQCSSFPLRHSSRVRALESLFTPLPLHVPGAPRHAYCISQSGVLSTSTCGNFTTWSDVLNY